MTSYFAKDMWSNNHLPSLEGVDTFNGYRFTFDRVFLGGGPTDKTEFNLLVNFLRLVDAAIYDYSFAHHTWEELIEKREQRPDLFLHDYIFRIIQLLENHVVALHRSITFAKALHCKTINGTIFRLDRNTITKHDEARIRSFRHTIQHWDERITGAAANTRKPKKLLARIKKHICNKNYKPKPIVEKDTPNSLIFTESDIVMLDNKIKYHELKKWLEHLFVLAKNSYNV